MIESGNCRIYHHAGTVSSQLKPMVPEQLTFFKLTLVAKTIPMKFRLDIMSRVNLRSVN
jgi:hypothetical protein